jgi:hypothetical protein
MSRHRGLARALARADHRHRRLGRNLRAGRRLEAEVGTLVGHTVQQGDRNQVHAHAQVDDRLVRQVEHQLGREPGHRRGHGLLGGASDDQWDTDLEAAVERDLLATAEEGGADDDATRNSGRDVLDRGAHNGGVVLTVDENESPQGLARPRERNGTPPL